MDIKHTILNLGSLHQSAEGDRPCLHCFLTASLTAYMDLFDGDGMTTGEVHAALTFMLAQSLACDDEDEKQQREAIAHCIKRLPELVKDCTKALEEGRVVRAMAEKQEAGKPH